MVHVPLGVVVHILFDVPIGAHTRILILDISMPKAY